MIPQSITDALEFGLVGLVLFIVVLPLLLVYWLAKRIYSWDY